MSPFDSLILGLIEGFTEFLPISSTAHLILASKILGLDQSAFVKTFEIAIQSGAILAVVVIYWKKFLDIEILKRLVVAFIPTAVIGLALYSFIKKYLIGNIYVVLTTLAVGGLALILFEKFFKPNNESGSNEIRELNYKKAALLGLAQAVAVVPGVSRSAATIVGGLFLGLSRTAVVEFSFLLAVPTIAAATGLDLVKNIGAFTADQSGLLIIGFISAFITAIIGIKFLLTHMKKGSFIGFGVYRIVVVLAFVTFFM